ncbi:MAG: alpha/beta hydrolase [Acidobacteriia bacterium]|nr:alpha/beta hydrolase [Terriglobia bacterium]
MDANLRTHGSSPFRVALIHGGPGAAGEMAVVARRLAQERGVLEPIQTATSVEGQVEELREVLTKHAALPAVLIGFSWGAWLSLLVASRFPQLVRKLILVSSGALEERYAARPHSTRLSRLNQRERVEFEAAIAALESDATGDPDALLDRLGSLARKADTYAPLEEPDEPGAVCPNGEIYRQVWKDAARMRRTGELLECAQQVVCPVVAVHGDYDPSPAAGVSEPLSARLREFRLVTLTNCGHTPWLERYAREEFYRVLRAELG